MQFLRQPRLFRVLRLPLFPRQILTLRPLLHLLRLRLWQHLHPLRLHLRQLPHPLRLHPQQPLPLYLPSPLLIRLMRLLVRVLLLRRRVRCRRLLPCLQSTAYRL